MAESATEKTVETVTEVMKKAVEDVINGTTNGTETVEKWKATPEGLGIAYMSLLVMALIPIVVGAFKSVKHQKNQQDSGEEIETMSTKEAMLFPVIASVTLFSIYMVFQVFSKDHINMLLAFYFFLIGIVALTRMASTLVTKIWPESLIMNEVYEVDFSFTQGAIKSNILMFRQQFDRSLCVSAVVGLSIGVWYLLKKHWIANNIFGLAFAVNGIEFLQLNKVLNGCILLGGLFFYDVFWVFGTDVMVTVAKSFDAPIKLIFPQDLIEHGLLGAEKYALLGLGDIVIPGIFIALMLRFDFSLNRNGSKLYFNTTFFAYILALATTIFVMHVFKHAQPALLYIVPMCLVAPLFVALVKGDLGTMFAYRDHEDEQEQDKSTEEKSEDKEEEKKDK